MSTSRHIDKICIIVIAAALIVTILFMNGEAFGMEKVIDEDAEMHSDSMYFTENDQDAAWSSEDAVEIVLADADTTIRGNGAYVLDGSVYIRNAGYYVVSGTLTDGSLVVDAHKSDKVWIRFDGADITCSDDAGLRVDKADKVFLTLAEGSENRISSGETYSEEALADGTGGAVYAHDDLTINGSGALTVTAAYRHGIEANDDLVIAGGTVTVDAAGDGIHVNDSLRMKDVTLTLTAGDDGIDLDGGDTADGQEGTETAPEDLNTGYLYVESGTCHIEAGDDGIHAAGSVTAAGGELTIEAGDDGIHSESDVTVSGGRIRIPSCYEGIEGTTVEIAGGDTEICPSDDGINATGTGIGISGGSLTIVNGDGQDADGLDSNGDIRITGGTVRISLNGESGMNNAIDYASERGGVCEVSGGSVVACGGIGMAENFSSGSAQPGILYGFEEVVEAGEEIRLLDAEGRVLLSYTPDCAFTAAALSCPELTVGETYTVEAGDVSEEITLDTVAVTAGFEGMGGMPGMHGTGQDGNVFGGRPEDSEIPGSGEMPAGEDRPEDGERPEPGEMPAENGERPEQGMRPPKGSRPEGVEQSGQGQQPADGEQKDGETS